MAAFFSAVTRAAVVSFTCLLAAFSSIFSSFSFFFATSAAAFAATFASSASLSLAALSSRSLLPVNHPASSSGWRLVGWWGGGVVGWWEDGMCDKSAGQIPRYERVGCTGMLA